MSRFFRQADDSDSDTEESEEELMSSDEEPSKATPAAKPKPMGMARFLKGAASDSSSSSDSDSDSDSDDSDDDDSDGDAKDKRRGSDESDSDEDTKSKPKSARDKRLEEMETVGRNIDNAVKINNWVGISTEFDKLVRLVQRETNVANPIPSMFIKTLVSLEGSLNNAVAKEKEAKKKMNALNAKALTAMKQKLKKTSKEFEADIKKYQDDPAAFEREYQALIEKETAPTKPKVVKKVAEEGQGSDQDDFTTVVKGGKSIAFTAESVLKNLQVVQEARGKKNTDRAEQIRILEKLLEVASTTYQRVRVLIALISSRFDYNASVTSHMPIELWLSAQREVDKLVTTLTDNPAYSIEEVVPDYDELAERTPESEKGPVRIRGSIMSFVDRLDDEFTKSLQNLDPHGTEYVERLRDEKGLYQTICRSQRFYEQTKQEDPLSRVLSRRLEHIYSKPDAVVQALESSIEASFAPSVTLTAAETTAALIHTLCTHLYKSPNPVIRTRAMLCHIYHRALHNDYHTARDMFLMSHLQESVHAADVTTQILYNRTVVQIGLCAFRVGLVKESQAVLQDIFGSQRVKELLAQGVHQQRYQTLTPEQEKAERQRQLPFHMHINTELLEAAFLVSSMLVEIPLLASIDSEEQKRKVVSKPFRRLLDFADRQAFTGPPESTRDHIMQASRALQEGEWEKCRDLVLSIKIWTLMPEVAQVKEMLTKRIQEEGLRTYLFTYAPHYSTLSLSLLSRTFSLPVRSVTSIISKMIWNEEISASLDQASGVVVFHQVQLTRTQQLASTLAERIGTMMDNSEKTLDAKLGLNTGQGWSRGGDKDDKGGAVERKTREKSRGGSSARGARGGSRGARFSQGLGNRMVGQQTTRVR